jgi:hypothetical protein
VVFIFGVVFNMPLIKLVVANHQSGETKMPKFILIDNCSGFVWGTAEGETPADACAALDRTIGVYNREYEECARPEFVNETGYFVHIVPEYVNEDGYFVHDATGFEWPADVDGTDEALVDAVSALPLVAYVRVMGEPA